MGSIPTTIPSKTAAHFFPWGYSKSKWLEIKASFAHHLRCHGKNLDIAVAIAAKMQQNLEALFPTLDKLCQRTCRFCPDPCCLVATVWFDFTDLLFLHLVNIPVPPAQLIAHYQHKCRYAGPKGCLLTRASRPWACTLYLCPTQMTVLRGADFSKYASFERAVAAIKGYRLAMEEAFLAVVAPQGKKSAGV
jgi:hypothetical protein